MNLIRYCFPSGTLFRLGVILTVSIILAGFRFLSDTHRQDALSFSQQVPSLNVRAAQNLGVPILWIDTRSEKEYQSGHIPGALWVDEGQYESIMDELLNRWKPQTALIVYCSSQKCSASRHVALRLKKTGFSPVYLLQGGWEVWPKP